MALRGPVPLLTRTDAGAEVQPALENTGHAGVEWGGKAGAEGQGWDRIAPAVAPCPALMEGD